MTKQTFRRLKSGPLLVVLLSVVLFACTSDDSQSRMSARSQTSSWPEIQVENLDGDMVDTADFNNDKVLVVTMWSTWCVPCRRELPQLQKFAETNSSISVVAVNLGDEAPSVRAYANELGLNMPILLDTYGRISSALGVASVPATILIQDKRVVAAHLGEISADELDEFVSQNTSVG
jgi:thiol-disulfide isomerase/thioredoxin